MNIIYTFQKPVLLKYIYIYGLVQDCSNSIANALELLPLTTRLVYASWHIHNTVISLLASESTDLICKHCCQWLKPFAAGKAMPRFLICWSIELQFLICWANSPGFLFAEPYSYGFLFDKAYNCLCATRLPWNQLLPILQFAFGS